MVHSGKELGTRISRKAGPFEKLRSENQANLPKDQDSYTKVIGDSVQLYGNKINIL